MEIIRKHSGLILVLILSIIPLANLLNPGLPVTHDSLEHTARIANFYQSLKEGNIIPRWAEFLNWNYGHPILMFLYPLPEYAASLIHLLGFSFENSFKILMAISYILSGIFMYLWLKKFLGENAAIAGSIIYLYAPYRFIDLYVRGALGEHVAFLFIPLVLLAILTLNQIPKKTKITKYYLGLLSISISLAGLILSHNAISLIFFPFIFIYALYLFYEHRSKTKILLTFISLGFGFLISFFFWFPAFVEGKYTLRDIVTAGAYSDRFVNIRDLIFGSWNYGESNEFTVQIGIIGIFISVICLILFFKLFKKNDKQKFLLFITYIFFIISILLMLKESSFIWEKITTLQKLQFPWRFLSLTIFSTSLITAIFVSKIKIKYQNVLVMLIIVFSILPTINFWKAKDYKVKSDNYYLKDYQGTTDTGESSPIWSIRFMETYPNNTIEIISGNAVIEKVSRTSTQHSYKISNKEKVRVKENTLYFPGWKIFDNNQLVNIEFQDPKNRGLMTFDLEPGTHLIKVIFENTKIRQISEFISFFSILTIFFLPIAFTVKKIRNIKL